MNEETTMSNPQIDNTVAAQDPKEPTAQIELTINQINVVLAALQELPHRVADPILKTIVAQVQPQVTG